MFDQHKNFQGAILKNKARIEEINLILARPKPRGHPTNSRRRLIETRLHLEQAVAELEREDRRLQSMKAARTPFRWEDIDQRLLSPKLQDVAEEMQQLAAEAERKASFDTRLNSAGYLPRFFEMQRDVVDEWAKRLYDVHREVWRIQGHSISAPFIRAVSGRSIAALMVARKGAVQAIAESWLKRTGAAMGGAPSLGHWALLLERLAAQWTRKLEAEAVAAEYGTRGNHEGSPGQPTSERRLIETNAGAGAKYPIEFPSEARARVEAEKIRAGRDFDLARQSASRTSAVEAQLRNYILRTVLVFTKEAQALELWPVEEMDAQCREFLRLFTIDAYYERGYSITGGRLRDMVSNWNGSILPEVQREFEKAPEWKQYQDALLEVAEGQIATGDRRSELKATAPSSIVTPKKTSIGRNIDRLRKECGWSFNDVAEKTGLDKKLILGHVNLGKGTRPNTLKMYADAFGKKLGRPVTVAELES